jgi:hypothetical protein
MIQDPSKLNKVQKNSNGEREPCSRRSRERGREGEREGGREGGEERHSGSEIFDVALDFSSYHLPP